MPVSLFADDLKMYGPSSKNDTLQADLDELAAWQDTWLLRFNTTDGKCKVMHVGSHNPRNKYYLDSVELPKIDSEKDLGVLVSENWKWDQHISSIVKKATSMSAWVLRTVISRSPEVMLQIYKTFIRPHLEYCVQLWSPLPTHGNWGMIMVIENVQRQFTRAIHGIGLLPYKICLHKLRLTTLLLLQVFKSSRNLAYFLSRDRLKHIVSFHDSKLVEVSSSVRLRCLGTRNAISLSGMLTQTPELFRDITTKSLLYAKGSDTQLATTILWWLTHRRDARM